MWNTCGLHLIVPVFGSVPPILLCCNLGQVAEIQAVVHCIMEEKDRLQEAHREQLREAKQAMEGREQEVG